VHKGAQNKGRNFYRLPTAAPVLMDDPTYISTANRAKLKMYFLKKFQRIFVILKTYQLRNVDPVAEQVGYDLLGVVHGPVRVSIDQDLLQALVH
jgi:hypothetical protein